MLAWIDIPEDQFPDLFEHFLSGLPIEKDYAENQWVIKSILRLLVNKQHLVTYRSFVKPFLNQPKMTRIL